MLELAVVPLVCIGVVVMSATDAYIYVECCDRRVPLERATRVSVGNGWSYVCRDGMGCTTDHLCAPCAKLELEAQP